MGSAGDRIRAARGYGGLTQKALADLLEVHINTLKRIESGEGRGLKHPELLALSNETKVPMWFLEGGWENYPGAGGATAAGDADPAPLDPGGLARRLGDDEDDAASA